ncbi:MAG: ABC transporter substrate-binding protein, partial [Sphaerochaetaceae bacterium]|nr:ABC transporter substrate-binding protein [Sphaerochaetaceae bacterium]
MSHIMFKHRILSLLILILFISVILTPLFSQGSSEENSPESEHSQVSDTVTFTVSTPPDPNFIPAAILAAKADQWMEGIEVELVTAPAGDPSAMRALAQNRSVDFALFNLQAGSKFYTTGISHIRLVGSHVWKGVYLLARDSVTDLSELNGETLLAVPAIKTPPHIMSEKALRLSGVSAEFIPAGSGPSLFALLSQKNRAPKAFTAPEPLVSIILARQEKDNWPVRYRVFMDPQRILDPAEGKVPTGSLWLINPGVLDSNPQAVEDFVSGFERANSYAVDPANAEEVAQIVSETLAEIYGQSAGRQVYLDMLNSGRLDLDFRHADEIREVVISNLRTLY